MTTDDDPDGLPPESGQGDRVAAGLFGALVGVLVGFLVASVTGAYLPCILIGAAIGCVAGALLGRDGLAAILWWSD